MAVSFSVWSKTFDKCGYGGVNKVGIQFGSTRADSVEKRHPCRIFSGLSGKFLGVNKQYCFKGS